MYSLNGRYLEILVLGIGSRWADRNRPMIAASRDGGNMSNRGLSGLFKIFLKKKSFRFSLRACNATNVGTLLTIFRCCLCLTE